jgi:hypothetical protein
VAWSTREIAELAGTTVRAVRHYHEVGLLDEPKRRANGYKQYGVAHLIRLLRIKRCPGDSGGPALNSRGNIVGIASSANSAGNSNYDPTYVAYSWIFDTEVVRRAIGKVTFLRLHDVNTGFGPPADPTPGELVVSLDSEPNVWFGLPLRVGTSEAMAKGSLDLVRDSFVNDSVIVIEHQAVGPTGRKVIRVIRSSG